MNSLFTSNRSPFALKRRPRATTKAKQPAYSMHLDILPDLQEEDEEEAPPSPTLSFDSARSYVGGFTPSRSVGGSLTLGGRSAKDIAERKRDSRRVVLTGAEGLSFDDFFPQSGAPAPREPARTSYMHPLSLSPIESPLDNINLRFSGLGISLDFPSPPRESFSESSTPTPTMPKRRDHSPTSSISSNNTSSSSSSGCKSIIITPPTSDDESPARLMRAPTCKSHRASVVYAKSMSDIRQSVSSQSVDDWSDDAEWFANDISDIITLSTPLPPSFPLEHEKPARPDSIMTGRSRQSKVLPPVPASISRPQPKSPSLQLDPMFPLHRRSFLIPNRPPPPPPTYRNSTMEEETEDLLAQLASAALGAGFLGTELTRSALESTSVPPTPSSSYIVPASPCEQQRPPPRMSIPADINDSFDDAPLSGELDGSFLPVPQPAYPAWPSSPGSSSVYSQSSMARTQSPVSIEFDFDVVIAGEPAEEPATPEIVRSAAPVTTERTLRSRWSSSTLGSVAERQAQSGSSWLPRFNLSPSKKNKDKPAPAPVAVKRSSAIKAPFSPSFKKSFDLDGGLQRRDSRSSRMSDAASDSGESSTSSGLRRKPIPVEIFMRS